MARRDSSSRPNPPSGRGPVPTLEGIFPRSHPSTETLLKLGAAALLLGPLAGVPAILLGRLTVGEIERSGGRYAGEARARLGLSLGWAGTLLHALLGLYFLGAFSEAIALVVLGLGAAVALVVAVGALVPAAPRPFLAAGALARRAPRLVVPAVIGLMAAGAVGFVSKRSADERARLELEAAEREAAEVAAKEREEARRRGEEAAALAARRRAEEEARRAEREREAAARFPEVEKIVASRLQLASAKSAQRRWDEAEVALNQASAALEELRDTEVARSERWSSLSAQVERLRPAIHARVEQLRKQREEQERLKEERERQQEERARRLEEAREAAAARAASAREQRRGSLRLMCCDGTLSPSCLCDGPRRGCCSHHKGVCGCEE